MDWTDEQQSRFDNLCEHELVGILTGVEQQELDMLMAVLIEAADEALLPAITRLQHEQGVLELRLQQRQCGNEELVKRLHQQVKMMAELR